MLRRLFLVFSLLVIVGAGSAACAPAAPQPVYTGSVELTDQWVKLRSQTFEVAVEAPDTEGTSGKVGLFCRPLANKKCPAHIDMQWHDVSTTASVSDYWFEGNDSFGINITMPENGVVKVEWTNNLSNYEVGQVGGIVGNFAVAGSMVMTKGNSYSFSSPEYTLIFTPLVLTDEGWGMDAKCIGVGLACPETIKTGSVLVPMESFFDWPVYGWNEDIYHNGQPTGETFHIDLSFTADSDGIIIKWSDGIAPSN